MQQRHTDRKRYFCELAATSADYYLPYLEPWLKPGGAASVLEIGCGEGGNLLPFARRGWRVVGVDLSASRIGQARQFFAEEGAEGTFICSDIFKLTDEELRAAGAVVEGGFRLLLLHDVIEHITDKERLLRELHRFLAPGGIVFMGFPAWQMPFGGHQQVCRSRVASHFPFLHLLPVPLYGGFLRMCGETKARIDELLDIKRCGLTVERFERLARQCGFRIAHRQLWFINPHYRQKYGLTPRRLYGWLGRIPVVRNFFSTSCFYLLQGSTTIVPPAECAAYSGA